MKMIMIMITGAMFFLGQLLSFVTPTAFFWEVESFERIPHSSECTCGISTGVSKTPWTVYIHTQSQTCQATIINSNLVVTSHHCLLANPKARMHVAEIFQFTFGEHIIARKSELIVTPSLNGSSSMKFPIKNVWFNPAYAVSSETNSFPDQDMVILQLQTDFLSDSVYNPICVPQHAEDADEETSIGNGIRGYFRKPTGSMARVWGVISRLKDCDEKSEDKETSTVCMKYEARSEIKSGLPLVITSTTASFLIGIAINPEYSSHKAVRRVQYAYFSFINSLIKFIEYFAHKAGSEWCRTPSFSWTDMHAFKGPGSGSLNESLHKNRYLNKMSTCCLRHGFNETEESEKDDDGTKKWASKPWETEEARARVESLDCLCGVRNYAMTGRIAGGVQASPREFGWMAGLQLHMNGGNGGSMICGGSIINDRIILTAAHCVVVDSLAIATSGKSKVTIAPSNIDVVLNAHERAGDPKAVIKHVSAILFHPDYLLGRTEFPDYYDKDIALLVLKDPLDFPSKGDGLRPVCLPKQGPYMEVVGKMAWVVGWGLTDPKNDATAAKKLQKINLPIAKLSMCKDISRLIITENVLCAGTLDMYHDAARGDSGGPLQIEDTKSRRWTQVGAVSFGEDVVVPGGKTLTAGLYTDLQKVMDFIDYHSNRVGAKWCRSVEDSGPKRNQTEPELVQSVEY